MLLVLEVTFDISQVTVSKGADEDEPCTIKGTRSIHGFKTDSHTASDAKFQLGTLHTLACAPQAGSK